MSTVEQIRTVVESIPAGRVMTYGAIAEQVEGASARSVGRALAADGHDVPWWRVVSASGRPAPGAERAAHDHFQEEGTPLEERADGTYSVALPAAMWPVVEP